MIEPLQDALEFAGYSATNKYEMIHGNKIGSKAVSVLKSNTLLSLVEYRNELLNKMDAYNNRFKIAEEEKRRKEEIKRRQDEENRRKQAKIQEEEDYFTQHGMFGILGD